MRLKYLIISVLIAIAYFMMQSCSVERKLARSFVDNNSKGAILLMYPDFLYKNNLRDVSDKNIKKLEENKRDSVLLTKSLFLKYIDDEIFLNKYYLALKDELQKMGFIIFEESATDTFLLSANPAWILNLAQFQLEEEVEPFTDYHYFDTTFYSKDFLLNKVSLHSWLEFSPLNSENKQMQVLYSVQSVKDKIDGKFKRHLIWGDVDYEYSIVAVNISHVYDFGDYSAKKHATYLFDYIMNNYINDNMPNNWKQNKYFHYNIEKNRFENFKEGFIIIK